MSETQDPVTTVVADPAVATAPAAIDSRISLADGTFVEAALMVRRPDVLTHAFLNHGGADYRKPFKNDFPAAHMLVINVFTAQPSQPADIYGVDVDRFKASYTPQGGEPFTYNRIEPIKATQITSDQTFPINNTGTPEALSGRAGQWLVQQVGNNEVHLFEGTQITMYYEPAPATNDTKT